MTALGTVRRQRAEERERVTDSIARYLDAPMTVLGFIFLLVVLGQNLADPGSALATALTVAGWLIWAAFVVEFVVRLIVAPSTTRFLKRNWWQIPILALPFLRFLRLLRAFRVARAGRVLSSAVRGTRTATRTLSGRITWLIAIHVIVVLTASQLLFTFAGYASYADALHAAALSSVSGEPLGRPSAAAKVIEIVLAVYAAVLFAALAATLASFLFEKRRDTHQPPDGPA